MQLVMSYYGLELHGSRGKTGNTCSNRAESSRSNGNNSSEFFIENITLGTAGDEEVGIDEVTLD